MAREGTEGHMTGNQGQEPTMNKETRRNRRATRFSINHNWNWRGDNAKPKGKK